MIDILRWSIRCKVERYQVGRFDFKRTLFTFESEAAFRKHEAISF